MATCQVTETIVLGNFYKNGYYYYYKHCACVCMHVCVRPCVCMCMHACLSVCVNASVCA